MSFKETMNKIGSYVKERITKKEITSFVGLVLMLAGPAGWATNEQITIVKAILTASGYFDPSIGAGSLSAIGTALLLYKEKK